MDYSVSLPLVTMGGKNALFRYLVSRKEPTMTVPGRRPVWTVDGAPERPERCDLIRSMLNLLGQRWPVIVLQVLGNGPLRFNELRRAVTPVTQRMLSASLRGLERDGLITRTVYPSVPPKVEYELTEAGRTLNTALYNIADWADANLETVTAARAAYEAG